MQLPGRSCTCTLHPPSHWRLTSLRGCFHWHSHVPDEESETQRKSCLANTPNPPETHWCGLSSPGVQKSSTDAFHAPGNNEECFTYQINKTFISLWKTKQNDVPRKSGFLVLEWQSQIWGFAKFSWHIIIWKGQVSATAMRRKWTMKGEDWVKTLGIPRCPPVTEQDSMWPSWDRPLSHILCFSSALKYPDNSLRCIFPELFYRC